MSGCNKGVNEMFLDTTFLKSNEINLILERTVDGDDEKGWVPAYHFAICNQEGIKMGVCDLRLGHNDNLLNFPTSKVGEYA